eukprot:TRINITY_DN14915_c0_g1_i1.p1 TRINITY_DN14915_c0_g1~~TRINITY_DN14915_c0_g1_i1.p1  ORF type:complete len:957 (+),score=84.35 TRINITY_DN14915_c0_g1_i1:52-2922(+)
MAHTPNVSGTHTYSRAAFVEGVSQFTDRKYVLTNVPSFLLDTWLYQGPCHHNQGDQIVFSVPPGTPLFILVGNGNGTSERSAISTLLGDWKRVETSMNTNSFKEAGFDVFHKVVDGAFTLTLNTHIELSIAVPRERFPVSGTHSYSKAAFDEGVRQFTDRKYVLTNVPSFLLDTWLYQGPCHHNQGDQIVFSVPPGTPLFILVGNGNGTSERSAISTLLGDWKRVETSMNTNSFKEAGFDVFHKVVDGAFTLTLNTHIELSIAVPREHFRASGTHPYSKAAFDEGVRQFNDRKYVLTNVPDIPLGMTLFQGPCHHNAGDEITFSGPTGTPIFIMVSNGNTEAEKAAIRTLLGNWVQAEVSMCTGSLKTSGFQVYHRCLDDTFTVTLNTHIELSIAMAVARCADPNWLAMGKSNAVKAYFKSFDENGDGVITKEELSKHFKDWSDQDIDALWYAADKNQDGIITLDEFVEWVMPPGQDGTLKLDPASVVKKGDRVVAQWGGNNLWYSGCVRKVSSPTTCTILPDDGLSPSNRAGWTDLSPAQVYKSSDDGMQKKWCWGVRTPAEFPDTHELVLCSLFHHEVVLTVGDRVVAQWGGNNLWYSGSILKVSSPTLCSILPDDGLSSGNEAGWTDLSPDRVCKSNDDGMQKKWCWRVSSPGDCPNTFQLVRSTIFQADARDLPLGENEVWFTGYEGPPIKIHYSVSDTCNENARVLIVIHGQGRNAEGYHNAAVQCVDGKNVVIITPHYPKSDFGSSDRFQCGGVIVGEEQPRNKWTFASIDGAFKLVKEKLGLQAESYSMYGHSAGAQFIHRFLYWNPQSPVDTAAVANPGWWTMPDLAQMWPYGLQGTSVCTEENLRRFLSFPLLVTLGTADTDPNHEALRRTPQAMLQGEHRFARGQTFVAMMKQRATDLACPCRVTEVHLDGACHSNRLMCDASVKNMWPDLWDEPPPGYIKTQGDV